MEIVTGIVKRITFYSEETGYHVLRLAPEHPADIYSNLDEHGLLTVVGSMPEVIPGEVLQIQGRWERHREHGVQFTAQKVKRTYPTTVQGIEQYLSHKIKGIGPKTAEAIVETFGEETLIVLDDEPERLYDIDGIGSSKVKSIIRQWEQQRRERHLSLSMESFGITGKLAFKIIETYGNDTIDQLQTDPYRLAQDISGVGFRTADQIAQQVGLPANHPSRLEAGVAHALSTAENDGHLYLPEEELAKTAAELLDVSTDETKEAIYRTQRLGMLIVEQNPKGYPAIYLPLNYHSERGVARSVERLMDYPHSRLKGPVGEWRHMIDAAINHSDIELSPLQRKAIESSLTNKISVLTGGPGTGKTTTLRILIKVLLANHITFSLASPTGRAAKRLSEATGFPAKTIHRLLGFSPRDGFQSNEDNPLPADFIIIDEASMLDAVLAYALFRAVDKRSHILLVGDVDQLPSVGAGNVLKDVIDSDQVVVTRLNAIFRQASGSFIVHNAHRINQGEMPDFGDHIEDFFLFKIADDPQRAADLVVDIVQRRVPQRFGYDPFRDIQVLVPMYRGEAGVSSLNERLQQALNPKGRPAEKRFDERMTFRAGDKVLQTRNNYEKEVFNGDVGRIKLFNKDGSMVVNFEGQLVEYKSDEARGELIHAYAMSVHRSQGSEYPVVVIPMLTQHYMLLQRNLLYTAITRARKIAILVGSDKAIGMAVRNNKEAMRYTALAQRLRGELGEKEKETGA